MRILNRIVGIEGVAASATVSIKLPVNRRYHGLKFFITQAGSPVAVTTIVNRVRAKVNGKTIRDLSAARALAIPTLNGVTPATGELPIQFAEPWRADKDDEQVLAWDMFGEASFEIELELTAAANPGVTGVAIFDFGRTLIDGQPAKNIMRQLEQGKNATAGTNDFDNLSRLLPIHRILLFSTEVISAVEVTADDNKVYEVTNAENLRVLADHGLVGGGIAFPIVFDFTERVFGEALVALRTLNARFTIANAAGVTAVMESRAPGFE